MHYLYGSKPKGEPRLLATFGSEQQLLAYVRWATLSDQGQARKFEQQSVLAGYENWRHSEQPLTADDPEQVVHNPSPTML
ncbi:MAG: hypothetical protein AB7O59_00155 [Pirellulales bacterium]